MNEGRKELVKILVIGLILGIVLIIVVFVTGQTFGQRCAEIYKVDSPEWCDCVDSLTTGRK